MRPVSKYYFYLLQVLDFSLHLYSVSTDILAFGSTKQAHGLNWVKFLQDHGI